MFKNMWNFVIFKVMNDKRFITVSVRNEDDFKDMFKRFGDEKYVVISQHGLNLFGVYWSDVCKQWIVIGSLDEFGNDIDLIKNYMLNVGCAADVVYTCSFYDTMDFITYIFQQDILKEAFHAMLWENNVKDLIKDYYDKLGCLVKLPGRGYGVFVGITASVSDYYYLIFNIETKSLSLYSVVGKLDVVEEHVELDMSVLKYVRPNVFGGYLLKDEWYPMINRLRAKYFLRNKSVDVELISI